MIDSASVQQTLNVDLNSGTDVDQLSLTGPDGETWREKSVGDTDTVSVNLLSSGGYPPGEQTINAHDSEGNVIGSTTIDISPNIEITEIGFAKSYDIPNGGLERPFRPVVHVENTGSGPDTVERLEIESPLTGDRYEPEPVIRKNAESGASATASSGIPVASGERQGVRVDHPALGAIGANRDCEQTINATVTAGLLISSDETVEVTVSGVAPEETPRGMRGGFELRNEQCSLNTEIQ
ncbi:hypothetical protein [Halorhabdus rudnickae]|uniref:hypothetical protein n=1 Tax=Halorhabdus rudnickae TaxID=1775544 RepID=UPI0010839080|nr:hypothetical protein [Halorhabdus rudnickae]